MRFGENHLVEMDTLTAAQVPVYLEFLGHQRDRHLHEAGNARAMIGELETSIELWQSEHRRHNGKYHACVELMSAVEQKLKDGYWNSP